MVQPRHCAEVSALRGLSMTKQAAVHLQWISTLERLSGTGGQHIGRKRGVEIDEGARVPGASRV